MNLHQKPNENTWRVLVLFLKKTAEDKGIRQKEIAEALGIKQSSVARIFSLKYVPSIEVYINIATVLGLKIFFEDTSENTSDLSKIFESAMTELGRRSDSFNPN